MLTLSGTGWRLDPWREMERLRRDISNLITQSVRYPAVNFPPMNMYAGENDVIITSEIPGVDPSLIELTVSGDTLIIRGSREVQELRPDEKWHRRERPHGSFNRTIELPFNVDASKTVAEFSKGRLKITLSRAEAEKPRKIDIKAVS
jgi:HSP20 family protein